MSVVYWNSNLPQNGKSVKERVVSGERRIEVWISLLSSWFNSLFGTQTWNETENQKRLSYWRFWVPLLVTLQHKWKWIKCVR